MIRPCIISHGAERAVCLRRLLVHAEAEARAREAIAIRWCSFAAWERSVAAWLEVERLRAEIADAENPDEDMPR